MTQWILDCGVMNAARLYFVKRRSFVLFSERGAWQVMQFYKLMGSLMAPKLVGS